MDTDGNLNIAKKKQEEGLDNFLKKIKVRNYQKQIIMKSAKIIVN